MSFRIRYTRLETKTSFSTRGFEHVVRKSKTWRGDYDCAEVTVTVLGVKGERVKIGILAPVEVPVHRREIRERIEVPPRRRSALNEHYAVMPSMTWVPSPRGGRS